MRVAVRHGRCLLILEGMKKVSVGDVGLMGCFLGIPFFVTLCRFAMMLRGELQMLCSLDVIVRGLLRDVLVGHTSSTSKFWAEVGGLRTHSERRNCHVVERTTPR